MSRRLLLALEVLVLTGCVDRFFYYPDNTDYGTPAQDGLAFEPVDFPSADGTRLSGWFLPAVGRRLGTVVHAHGNAANISNHVHGAVFLPRAGFNVLEFDYRGFGQSQGAPERDGCVADVEAALDYVRSRPDVDRNKVALFGQSLGAALSIVVAARRPDVAALVAEAPFTSHRDIARAVLARNPLTALAAWPLSRMVSPDHAPRDAVARVAPRPLLLVHGSRDELIPLSMSQELYALAGEPKALHVVDGGRHLAIPSPAAALEYERVVTRFFQDALR